MLGTHQGIWNYTVGQRKGLGIAAEKPLYVLGFDVEKNNVIVGFEDENVRHTLTASNVNWSGVTPITEPRRFTAKIRSSQPATPVLATPLSESEIKVDFELTQRGIAPGQSVVLYDGDLVAGGGIIDAVR